MMKSETSQTELRLAIDYMKSEGGSGSKARKQERFVSIYEPNVAHIVAGERYDDAGVGPATAQSAVERVFGSVPDYADTISGGLSQLATSGDNSLDALVEDLDEIAELSGDEQEDAIVEALVQHRKPSLVTLALLDDESIGLGTSQMREAFFDGTRDERKHAEAFTETTEEFIRLARVDELPDRPVIGEPFDPMLAVPESRGQPQNPVAQRKLDGYRVLIHVEDGEATAFSRRRNDITPSLPELNEIDWIDGDYILDGEVMAENGSYSDTSERIGRKAENVERDVDMTFHLFDAVVLNDYVGDRPYSDRCGGLNVFVRCLDSAHVEVVHTSADIEAAKDAAVAEGAEGIIVKDAESPYEFGKRSTYWQKQKIDDETCDVVISGFEEGTGEASGTLGAVALETADGSHIGKSGSGFSDELRDEIWNNQEDWYGRCIEVEARGVGSQGNLRMPIFVADRQDDGEPDTRERIEEVMNEI